MPNTYGASLPDQFGLLSTHLSTYIDFLSDARDLLRERATLDREYAGKLRVLAAKAAEKRAKKVRDLVLGEEPSRAWGEETLNRHTLDSAYQVFLASLENTARDHITLFDALNTEVADALKSVEKRGEDLRKIHANNFQTLVGERDRIYGERTKAKQKYDDACLAVESFRRKQDGSERHAEKAAQQFEQLTVTMLTTKNAYIVMTAVANKEKDKYFEEDLPALEDQMQDLQTALTKRLVALLQNANALHLAHLSRLASHHTTSQSSLAAVSPAADQDLFIEHNRRPFALPQDWTFEPCASHYDTPDMSFEAEPKVFIQNRLTHAKSKVANVKPEAEAKRREVANLQKVLSTYRENPKLGDADEVAKTLAENTQQLAMLSTTVATLEAEMAVISAALGGDEGGGQPHAFKSSSFSIPTTCWLCNTSIWGLSSKGKTCKTCGISVHNKCEMKVPAECGNPDSKPPRSSVQASAKGGSGVSLTRSSTNASVASSASASSVTTPSLTPTRSTIQEEDDATSPVNGEGKRANVLFTFSATSGAGLSVNEGDVVTIVDDDDGSGWVEVADKRGGTGVVPASYLQIISAAKPAGGRRKAPPPPPGRGSKLFVKVLFDYAPQTADELALTEGEKIELTAGGDKDPGWWEGVKNGRKGLFPANYVEKC